MNITAYVTHPMNPGGFFWQVFDVTSNVEECVAARGYIMDRYVINKTAPKKAPYKRKEVVHVESAGAHLFNVWNSGKVCHHA
jgi:hypothetical protein